MGDSGEGLVDAESRIQERMEEMRRERELQKAGGGQKPAFERELESLRLARTQLEHQLKNTSHAGRSAQLSQALAEVDKRIAELQPGI